MLSAQSPVAGAQKLRLKSGRKPLQPRNPPANETPAKTKPKSKQEWIEISVLRDSNKENHPIYATPTKIEPFNASLAEELIAIRKKLERLKLDRERTEKMLKERDRVLDLQMRELQQREDIQKKLEIEVDRLYRIKELKSYCMRISPIRSLRDKEQEKKINEGQWQKMVAPDAAEESVDDNSLQLQSPSSVSSMSVTEIQKC